VPNKNNMGQVTIYTTPTCGFCKMAKVYFTDRDISFATRDVSVDHNAYRELLGKSGQLGVPVIDIDGTVVVGFDRARIDTILRQKKLIQKQSRCDIDRR